MARSSFTLTGFLIRWVIAVLLVFATFNPTSYSFLIWVTTTPWSESLPLKALALVVLVIGWIIYLRATMRSIGIVGVVLLVILFAVVGWVIATYVGADFLGSGDLMLWAGLVAVSLILAVGLSWSHIHRKISGQLDVDEADI